MYTHILKPILFMCDPEWVHDVFVAIGEWLGSHRIGRFLVGSLYQYKGKDVSCTVDGIVYRTPFVLAAGFDYNGRLINILPYIGLGGVEVGSITARPCKGNPTPRLRRLPHSRSIIVNKGLKNEGVDAIITRLQRRMHTPASHIPFVVGISIARTNDELSASIDAGIEDYAYSFARLNQEQVGDYYTINISCPNSFGGESFTDPLLLERLMSRLDMIPCKKPIYVKMPITITWHACKSILEVLARHRVNGVIIGNLQKDYSKVSHDPGVPIAYCGGLSGEPCREASNTLIRNTKSSFGTRFTIIGCGGVMMPIHAQEKYDAGADVIQLISGMIFEGPGLIRRLILKSGIPSR